MSETTFNLTNAALLSSESGIRGGGGGGLYDYDKIIYTCTYIHVTYSRGGGGGGMGGSRIC